MTADISAQLDSPINPPISSQTDSNIAGFEVRDKISKLQTLILAQHPVMPKMLKLIHDQLQQDPEIVTLLTEEEIGILVNGLKIQTRTEIVTAKPTKESSAKLKAKASNIDMF